MRILLFTGKGGVGKTTVAAATALACASAGRRTAIMSTDPAHSLADAFGVDLGDELVEVAPNLHAQQLDARRRMETHWSEIRGYLRAVFDWAGLDEVQAEELSVIPGLDELFALTDIGDVDESGRYDVLVVDCAPTAETIRFLSLPDILEWYMDHLFPLGRRLSRVAGPVVSRLTGGLPIATDEVFGSVDRLYRRLDGVTDLLRDPARTSVRLVVNPEKIVVAEARRTYTYLSLFGYQVDSVIVNRLLPQAVSDPWFDRWRKVQAEQLADIHRSFDPLPVLEVPLAPSEIVGVEALGSFAATIYGERTPDERLSSLQPFTIDPDGDDLVLGLPVRGAELEEIDLSRVGSEIFVTVGPYRRVMVLPDSLARRQVTGASLDHGTLRIVFATP